MKIISTFFNVIMLALFVKVDVKIREWDVILWTHKGPTSGSEASIYCQLVFPHGVNSQKFKFDNEKDEFQYDNANIKTVRTTENGTLVAIRLYLEPTATSTIDFLYLSNALVILKDNGNRYNISIPNQWIMPQTNIGHNFSVAHSDTGLRPVEWHCTVSTADDKQAFMTSRKELYLNGRVTSSQVIYLVSPGHKGFKQNSVDRFTFRTGDIEPLISLKLCFWHRQREYWLLKNFTLFSTISQTEYIFKREAWFVLRKNNQRQCEELIVNSTNYFKLTTVRSSFVSEEADRNTTKTTTTTTTMRADFVTDLDYENQTKEEANNTKTVDPNGAYSNVDEKLEKIKIPFKTVAIVFVVLLLGLVVCSYLTTYCARPSNRDFSEDEKAPPTVDTTNYTQNESTGESNVSASYSETYDSYSRDSESYSYSYSESESSRFEST